MRTTKPAGVAADQDAVTPDVGDMVLVSWQDHCSYDDWDNVRLEYGLVTMVTLGKLMAVYDDRYVIASTFQEGRDGRIDGDSDQVCHVMVLVRKAVVEIRKLVQAKAGLMKKDEEGRILVCTVPVGSVARGRKGLTSYDPYRKLPT